MSKDAKVDPAKKFFDKTVSDRERAIFEGGIALGSIYHQFTGIPISQDTKVIEAVEKAIKSTMELQPFKERVDVKIRPEKFKGARRGPYDYGTLSGSALEVRVTAVYGKARALLAMKYVPELDYDLMFIENVTDEMD